ncbi:hypothetical protein I4U23_005969 [Adineta vaga]|nr:hypothetical protein I4U23_005969 [Adineta vaga]
MTSVFLTLNPTHIYPNITSRECKCIAFNNNAIGWNYFMTNRTCELIYNYLNNDTGLIIFNDSIYFFPEFLILSSTVLISNSSTTTLSNNFSFVSTTTKKNNGGPWCYYSNDYVKLTDGGYRRIGSLKSGDRVWTLTNDGQYLIEDEIIIVIHAGSNISIDFYTFITVEGHEISLTREHYIVIFDNLTKTIQTICAFQVTLKHQLITIDKFVKIKKIIFSKRMGFSSPITLSGYLLVNNLSTSTYVNYFKETHEYHHRIGNLPRMYYQLTKWLFGKNYKPFGIIIQEELHPLIIFIIYFSKPIQLFYSLLFTNF